MSAFCAVCTDATGVMVLRPLGKDDALVLVCMACDHGELRGGRYAFDGGRENTGAHGGGFARSLGEGNRRKAGHL